MNVDLSPEDLAFETEVRAFLADKFTPDLREAAARQTGVFAEGELARRWHGALFERGWIAPSWPRQHGGTGWSPTQRYIFDRECGLAGTPALPGMGLQMCGPVIMGHGTPEQQARFLPRILSGEDYWCQGYSEPGSGSDLASLTTRAVRDGDDYIVNGTKIWTTHAQFANWMFLLVRTDAAAKPQAGISFLLMPMDSPGVTVTPIVSMSGEHEVNSVFLDNVRVPVGNRVGAENDGWTVAKYLLEFERGGGSAAGRLRAQLRKLHDSARAEIGDDGRPLWHDPAMRQRVAQLDGEVMALEWTERRQAAARAAGAPAGNATASMLKLIVSETTQRIGELTLEVQGAYAAADQRPALAAGANEPGIGPPAALTTTVRYLNGRAATIFGGTSEVQRNILAKAGLGL